MKVCIILLSLVIGTSAFAECANPYKEQLKAIEGRLNPPRTTVISNVIAEGGVVGALAMAGTVPVTAIVALPAAALGAGAYYAFLTTQRANLRNAMHLINEAHEGKGPTLDRFMKMMNRKVKGGANRDEVINLIVQGDFDSKFCEFNPIKETYKLYPFRKILRYVKHQL